MNKIYLFCEPSDAFGHGFAGYALAEDGTGICGHFSSSIAFSKHDLGLTSDWKHDLYASHYPDGYDLEWVDDPDNHEGFQKAFELNQMHKEVLG